MAPAHSLTLSLASQVWSDLADRAEAFLAAWERGLDAANLADFLPDQPLAARRMMLVELVKIDLEQRWQTGRSPKLLEQYAEEHAEFRGGQGIPGDLIYEEFHIRRQAGDNVSVSDYIARFPGKADEIERLLGTDSLYRSTLLVKGKEPTSFDVGDRIEEFDLLAPLGKGAFATVYLARQATMQRIVALKVSSDRGDEPQTLAQLDHPYIVRVYDQRHLPDRKMRLLYMQHVPGGTLHSVIAAVGHISSRQRTGRDYLNAVDRMLERTGHEIPHDSVFRQRLEKASWHDVVCLVGGRLADALDYAHRQGVLHRDIKPANVLVAADGSPKLADFNVSFGSNVEGATPEAFFGGSLSYMSPEQIEAMNPACDRTPSAVDARSDVYSLGVLLWEFLEGDRPLGDEPMLLNWTETLDQMVRQRCSWCENPFNRSQNEPLKQVLRNCLQANAEKRPESAHRVAQELELCLHPEVRALLDGPETGWKAKAAAFPLIAVLVAVLLPNILAAVFNYHYNRAEIVETLQTREALTTFERVQLVINGIAFPLGIVLAFVVVRPISTALRQLRLTGHKPDAIVGVRHRALRLGQLSTLISVAEWLIAGIAYPVSLQLLAGSLSTSSAMHFVASLAISGLIAGAYPFFGVTFLVTRVFYPLLLKVDRNAPEDGPLLVQTSRMATLFLTLAAAVPLIAITFLVAIESRNRFALGILSAGGATLLAAAFVLHREIQKDLNLLTIAVPVSNGDNRASGERQLPLWTR